MNQATKNDAPPVPEKDADKPHVKPFVLMLVSRLDAQAWIQPPPSWDDKSVSACRDIVAQQMAARIRQEAYAKAILAGTDELLKLIRLDTKRDWLAGLLAHGEKQWLEIGMLLAQQPKLLLVDEPAAGMTDEETHRTGELLLSLAGKHSLIVIEHDMTFVRQIAHNGKVTVLHQGSVLCEGSFDSVQSNPKVREVYLGRGKPTK